MLMEVRAGEIEKPEHDGAEKATETMRATMDFMVTNSGLLIVGLLCNEIVFGVVVLFVGELLYLEVITVSWHNLVSGFCFTEVVRNTYA
jgi:hypothetical protein